MFILDDNDGDDDKSDDDGGDEDDGKRGKSERESVCERERERVREEGSGRLKRQSIICFKLKILN